MLAKLIGGVIGTKNERELKRMQKQVDKINGFEQSIAGLSDEELLKKNRSI